VQNIVRSRGCPSGREVGGTAADQGGRARGAAVEETLTYYAFPEEHWRRIRTNNPLERILREIKRRTRVVGTFPDGQSALNRTSPRLGYVTSLAPRGRPNDTSTSDC
jgi:Transposase, Mutator family